MADTTPAVMYKHVHEPPPLDELPSDLPQGVVAVLEKALAKKRKERYQSAGETARALMAAVETKVEPKVERKRKLAVVKKPEPARPAVLELRQPFEPEMILIPAGEFIMGSDSMKDSYSIEIEQPQYSLYLPDYHLAKTPVTNAQYVAFVQATGYGLPNHWKNGKPPSGKEDHPVINVSWHNAVAYCNWLAVVTGKPYCLPSEAEWEKGARGSDGRIYPWGNRWDAKRCHSFESGKEDTAPVGFYLEGASPYGLLDMAGNVWEWTRSLWGEDLDKPSFKYPYDPADGREDLDAPDSIFHVVRGGSFDYDARYARCAFRLRGIPNYFDWHYGFRVVVTPD